MKFKSIFVVATLAAAMSAHAQTQTLLDLTNPVVNGVASFSLAFTANGTSTTLSDAGYQIPGFTIFSSNSVTALGGGANLLAQNWALTRAAVGSDTSQYFDGAVNSLSFGGISVGNYDTYSQTFATTPGEAYVYKFNVDGFAGTPDGFRVSVTSAVPEPGSWALMLAGLGMVCGIARRKRAAR